AAQVCRTSMAFVGFIDADRVWFKARVGVDAAEAPRDATLCAHAIGRRDLLIVKDALRDPRFEKGPLVTGAIEARFYAATPLVSPAGDVLGSLCVLDRVPWDLEPQQVAALEALGREVVARLELRR